MLTPVARAVKRPLTKIGGPNARTRGAAVPPALVSCLSGVTVP